jgi:hypothetical protein
MARGLRRRNGGQWGTSKFGQCYRFDAFLNYSNDYSFIQGTTRIGSLKGDPHREDEAGKACLTRIRGFNGANWGEAHA